MGDMSREEIREVFRETVANRVPYYGEYLLEEGGDWVRNERHVDRPVPPADDD
jgi:cyclic pyranopterin phosphate synthase